MTNSFESDKITNMEDATLNITDYGYIPTPLSQGIPARVTAVHKDRLAVVSEYGEGYARVKNASYYDGREAYPTVGDFVAMEYIPDGDSRILATLPRRTYFSRRSPNPTRGEQAVAANFDYVMIVQSLNQDFNPNRLERYMTLAWESGATPVVVLTKLDLVKDAWNQILRAELAAPGAAVHAVSARTGEGLEALAPYLQPGKTLVFLGSSGVGKSSLVNALAGEEIMSTGSIRESDGKGRHTTTHRQLIRLPAGFMIIDTPGMRELGMWDVSQGLEEAFPEVEALLGRCRFRDCTHTSEPGCAIRAAIEAGELAEDRWLRYSSLKQEAKAADTKAEIMERKTEFYRNVAKAKKNRRKEIW